MRVDASSLEGSIEFGRDTEVGLRNYRRARLEETDAAAKIGKDGSDLASGVGRSDDGGCRRESFERSNVAIGESQLRPRDGQPSCVPAHGQDDVISMPTAIVARCQSVRVGEPNRPEVLDEVDPVTSQLVGQVFLLSDVAGHTIAVCQNGLKVGYRTRPFEAERGPRVPVSGQPRGPRHCANGCRPPVDVGSTDLVCLQQRDGGTVLAGLDGGSDPGGAPSDHEYGRSVGHATGQPGSTLDPTPRERGLGRGPSELGRTSHRGGSESCRRPFL